MARRSNDREAIRAFRQYARLGLGGFGSKSGDPPTKYGSTGLSVAKKYLLIEALCPTERSRLDLLAAHDTLRLLELNGEREVLEAVEAIYLRSLGRRGSEETARVWRFAREHFCDVRTVYRRLERARRLFLAVRGRETNS